MSPARGWGAAALETLTPRERLDLPAWADRFRVVARGTSPEAGPWRTSRVPYLREPMEAISDPDVERVICMWGSQLGKTDGILLNSIGYYAAQDPSPTLLVQPTEIAALAFVKERVDPTFRNSPALRGLLSTGKRDPDNTAVFKAFPGAYLACAWATSAVSLASRPIRVVLADEIDRWPLSTGKDGDPWAQAVQRTSNFHNRKIVAVSTPLIEGESRIEALYEETDQRRCYVPCPLCGVLQVLTWERVRYKTHGGDPDLDRISYNCEHCDRLVDERDKPAMLADCSWQPAHPQVERRRGFQLSALYSPWVRWRELAEEWIRATGNRDRNGLQEFVNLRLGEPWAVEAQQVTADGLDRNRIDYAAPVPAGVLVLTAGVDVQDNRLEVEIVGWGEGRQTWGIHYAILAGDTSDKTAAGPWAKLDALLARSWEAEGQAQPLALWATCIDSGGHRTDEVYEFCRDRHARNVFPVKGRGGGGVPIIGKPTLNKFRSPLYPVGDDAAKEAIYSRLQLQTPGPGYCNFPRDASTGYDSEWFRGLLSEQKRAKVRGGRKVYVWIQRYSRNEPLDCRKYATAALELLNPDFPALAAARAAATGGAAPAAAPKGRRILSPGVRW